MDGVKSAVHIGQRAQGSGVDRVDVSDENPVSAVIHDVFYPADKAGSLGQYWSRGGVGQRHISKPCVADLILRTGKVLCQILRVFRQEVHAEGVVLTDGSGNTTVAAQADQH